MKTVTLGIFLFLTTCPVLKGVCHEIFDLHFFHDMNPSGPLINRLKYFRIWFQFHRNIQIFEHSKLFCLRGVLLNRRDKITNNFLIKYLGEIEIGFENTLACLSWAQMGLNHEKNGSWKSHDTLPLKESRTVGKTNKTYN